MIASFSPSMSCGLMRIALPSSSAAPANSLSTQHAAVVDARGDVLLRDEVHAVAERGDEHDVGGEEQRDHLLARIRLVQVADRGVAHRVVVAVDPADGQLDLVAQLHVGLDALAARARDLHERDVLDVEPAVVEQLAVRLHPVPDALGVVEAVDAEQDPLRVAEALADLGGARLDVGAAGELDVRRGVDRDRERLREGAARRAVAVAAR